MVEDQPENQNYLQKIKVRNITSCVPRIPHAERLEDVFGDWIITSVPLFFKAIAKKTT